MTVWIAGIVTLVGSVAIALIGWWVASRQVPAEPAKEVTPRVYRARQRYFVTLSVVLVLLLTVTLPQVPYRGVAGAEPDVRLRAVGRMWAWQLEPAGGAQDIEQGAAGLSVPAGRPVTIDVTSEDVNHAFGVYDQRGRLLGQTQAMPGYVNRLILVFPEPGTYQVLCMEYCGVAHHVMAASIEAK
jgi:cytochrome c oxidase subunit 2